MEQRKTTFFLFRRKRDGKEGYEYIQFLQSPSYTGGLTLSCWPEYAWRGQSQMDVLKMKFMISISPYKDKDWELVKFEMDMDVPSWAKQPEPKVYESLPIKKFCRLTEKEEAELEDYKQKAIERYGRKE